MLDAFASFKDIANFGDVPNLLDVATDLNKSFGSGSKVVSKLLEAAEIVDKGIENAEKIKEKTEILVEKKEGKGKEKGKPVDTLLCPAGCKIPSGASTKGHAGESLGFDTLKAKP